MTLKICRRPIVVDHCEECDHVDRVYNYETKKEEWFCDFQDFIMGKWAQPEGFPRKTHPDIIPDWCPLEDYKEEK